MASESAGVSASRQSGVADLYTFSDVVVFSASDCFYVAALQNALLAVVAFGRDVEAGARDLWNGRFEQFHD